MVITIVILLCIGGLIVRYGVIPYYQWRPIILQTLEQADREERYLVEPIRSFLLYRIYN